MSTPAIRQVPLAKLTPDPNQPRKAFPESSLRELADSIKARGILQPLLVTEGKKGQLIILDGERRWRAAKLAKLKAIPVLVSKDAGDVTQRGIDQIATNSIRADLSTMDRARWLKAQRDNRLTTNDIAAAMAKAGMKAIDAKSIDRLVSLCDLPQFAADMVDAGQIEAEDALPLRILAKHKAAIAPAVKRLNEQVKWSGKVKRAEVGETIEEAFGDIGVDLKLIESWQATQGRPVVHFNWQSRCKQQDGRSPCEHLVNVAGGAWCMNKKLFQEHNQEAKDAGLLPGGKRPAAEKPPTPRQEEKAATEKAEQREQSLGRNLTDYLHEWLRERLLEKLPGNKILQSALVEFAALGMPGNYGAGSSILEARDALKIESISQVLTPEYLTARPQAVLPTIAAATVSHLDMSSTLALAHHSLGVTLDHLWTVDQKFLDLLRKAELAGIAEQHAALPEGRRAWSAMKTDELCAAILAVAEKIPVAPQLAGIYGDAIHASEFDDDEPELDDGAEDPEFDNEQGGDAGE